MTSGAPHFATGFSALGRSAPPWQIYLTLTADAFDSANYDAVKTAPGNAALVTMLPFVNKAKVKLTNLGLAAVWTTAFRAGYSAVRLRAHFELLAGKSPKVLTAKMPHAVFSPLTLGGVPAEVITASASPDKTIMYLHGGGYFMGSISTYRRDCVRLARRCNARVVIIEYRLAPEHPYPAALDDAHLAYLALHAAEGASARAGKLLLAGDSAGGGLALALALKLRDLSVPLPAGIIAISPWADLLGTGASMSLNRKKDVWLSKTHLTRWAPWYHQGHSPRLPYLSPVFGDYARLPPLLLLVGDQEVLQDDAVRIAAKAKAAGTAVTLHVAAQMQHNWLLLTPWLPESRAAMAEITLFAQRVAET